MVKLNSVLEKRLAWVVGILSLASIVLFIVVLATNIPGRRSSPPTPKKICTSTACLQAANYVKSSINDTLDPCHDFYEYACGGWRLTHDPGLDVSTLLDRHTLEQVEEILNTSGPDKLLQKASNFYEICTNTTRINWRGLNPLKRALTDLGGLPAIEPQKKNWNDYSWMEADIKSFLWTGYSYLVGLQLKEYNNKHYLSIGFQSEVANYPRKELKDALRRILLYIDDTLKDNYEKEIEEALDLYDDLVALNNKTDSVGRLMEVNELVEAVTELAWSHYFQMLNDSEIIIMPSTHIFVNVEYLQGLQAIVKAKNRTIANYVGFRFMLNMYFLLPDVIMEQLQPLIDPSLRNYLCFYQTLKTFQEILGLLYVRKHFPDATRKKTESMIELLAQQFEQMINQTDWLKNQDIKKEAMKKVMDMEFSSGYPKWMGHEELVRNIYKNMAEIEENEDSLQAFIQVNKFRMSHDLSWLLDDEKRFNLSPFIVSAIYERSTNKFGISAAMLNSPFYNDDYPGYMNLGAVGSIIGREITHGFDEIGMKMNTQWDNASSEEFGRQAQCFDNQYELLGIRNKRNQIIADNAGLRIAYKTFQSVGKTKDDGVLQGVTLTQNQMFFLSFAMIYCSKKESGSVYEWDSYPSKRSRVNAVLRNMPEFAEAFSCDRPSSMNPSEKCTLW